MAVVLLAQAAKVLPSHAYGMPALLPESDFVDQQGSFSCLGQKRRRAFGNLMEHLSIVSGRMAEKVVEALVVEFAQRISNGGTVCPDFFTLEKTSYITQGTVKYRLGTGLEKSLKRTKAINQANCHILRYLRIIEIIFFAVYLYSGLFL